jgi:shikimate kinase
MSTKQEISTEMKSKNKIYLIGLPGTGKSYLARLLAAEIGATTFDLDKLIEHQEGRKISEIFETDGEEHFRQIEANTLASVTEKESFILATGGGTPCFHDGIDHMNKHGITVYLTEKKEIIVERLSRTSHRPLVQGDVEKRVDELLAARGKIYEQADITISHRDPQLLLAAIQQLEV